MPLIKSQIEVMDFNSLLEHVKMLLAEIKLADKEPTCSKEELLNLCAQLDSKIARDYENALSAYNNIPEYPVFIPSDNLRYLKEKRAKLKEQVLVSGTKQKQLSTMSTNQSVKMAKRAQKIYNEMSNLFTEIKKLSLQEMQEQKKRYQHKHELLLKKYFDKKSKKELAEQDKKKARNLEVEKIKKEISDYFALRKANGAQKIMWQILPPGKWSIGQIKKHFKTLGSTGATREYDLERLELLETLKPATCYIGLEEFVGYVVFCFDYTDRAILENPIRGNAIYIIDSNWPEMSQLTKRELLSQHSDKVKRIIHRGDWFGRLKAKIAIKVDATKMRPCKV